MATLSLPLPRLTRWGVAVWTFNPLPVSMRSRGGDCKHQLEANLQTHWISSVLHSSNIVQKDREKKEFMIISTSKGPTLSAFLDLYSSSWASAVQFCLLGDEEGCLVYPENCTFTASGKTLGFVLEKKANTWTFVTSHFYRTAGFSTRLYWEVEQTKGRKWRAFLISGKLATHTVIIKHWWSYTGPLNVSFPHPLLPWVQSGTPGPTPAGTSSQTPAMHPGGEKKHASIKTTP